jgi:hypothetical protein
MMLVQPFARAGTQVGSRGAQSPADNPTGDIDGEESHRRHMVNRDITNEPSGYAAKLRSFVW